MWHIFLNKKVRVVKTDSYIKVGYLRGIEANLIFLEYFNGKIVSIPKDEIKSISEYKEDDRYEK